MLKRFKALGVAALLGSGLGFIVGLGIVLPGAAPDLPLSFHLSVVMNFAKTGALAGLAFALLLLGGFILTRRTPGVFGSTVLGSVSLFLGLGAYIMVFRPPMCGTTSHSIADLASIAAVGGACGGLVGVAARHAGGALESGGEPVRLSSPPAGSPVG
jgi:hypothetical protein